MRTDFAPGEFGASREALGTHVLTPKNGFVFLGRDVLVTGTYARQGVDLVVLDPEGGRYIIKGFFLLDHPPSLTDGGETFIPGELAASCASIAHDQFAQAGGAAGRG